VSLSLRNLRLVVMGSWSLFLIWLWQTGNVLRYLGPHTVWVVTFGAVALSTSTIAYAWFSRDGRDAGVAVSWRGAAGLVALLLPIAIGITLANASLGALAASSKLSARGVDMAELARTLASGSKEVSFLQIEGAGSDTTLRKQIGLRDGTRVALTGLVMEPSDVAGGRFELGRFYITCCVADALPIAVEVDPSLIDEGPYPEDQWLRVQGVLVDNGDNFTVEATQIEEIDEPAHPYLSFR
jgi:putative membrane protein